VPRYYRHGFKLVKIKYKISETSGKIKGKRKKTKKSSEMCVWALYQGACVKIP
jgi:hypothetical protein